MNSFIPLKPLSQTPGAVYMRTRYLTDDQWSEQVQKADVARKRRKRGADLVQQRKGTARYVNVRGALARRVAFHISKGRDAADIAIRENVPVSVVVGLMKGQE